jgi:hypothetical protein
MNTRLQEALKKASSEVEASGITDRELKKIAFSKAVDFYLHSLDVRPRGDTKDTSDIALQQPDSFWSLLENSTGVEISSLKDVYATKGNQILLVISSIPGDSRAEKQRNLAALVLLAYQEGFNQEWILSTLLAEAAKHSKLYDTSKFAKNLKSEWFRSEGVKKGLKYKLSGPGVSHAKDILIEVVK